jgi:hypothetical protein
LTVCGGGIALCKDNTCFGKCIDVRCFESTVVIAEIFPAKVICDDEENVWLVCGT